MMIGANVGMFICKGGMILDTIKYSPYPYLRYSLVKREGNDSMTCPRCGCEMVQVYISGDQYIWVCTNSKCK